MLGMMINKTCACGITHIVIPQDARPWMEDDKTLIGYVWECACKSSLFVPTLATQERIKSIKLEREAEEMGLAEEIEERLNVIFGLKKILVYTVILLGFGFHAQADSTSHITESGKYPFYFDDKGHPEVWDDTMQKEYDEKMSANLKELCSDRQALGEAEKEYIAADQKDVQELNSHADIGTKIESLKSEIQRLSLIVVKGTGKSSRDYGCPQ